MQRFSSYLLSFLLVLSLFTKPVLSYWYVNQYGKVISINEPQVLGRDDQRTIRRYPTATPTTRPTMRPTTRPTTTTAPQPSATIIPTNTSAPVPTNTQTPQPTITSTSTSGTTNFLPTATTQPTITQAATVQATSTPIPPRATEQPEKNQQTNTSTQAPTATPVPEQQNSSSDSWWKTFTDNLLNKNIEPTNTPSRERAKPTPSLPPPTNILRIESNDDQVGITKVDEQGNEKKLGDQLWLEIQSQKTAFDQTNFREEQTADTIRLGSGTNKSIIINRNNVSAETSLPVSVDLTTNGILVETTSGIKRITTLPDQIVTQSQNSQFITSVDKDKKIELIVENGIPVYKINGIRVGKFFGIISVSIQKQIIVSAEDGRLVKENLSILNQLLEKTSF